MILLIESNAFGHVEKSTFQNQGDFNSGIIYLTSGDKIECELKYNVQSNIVYGKMDDQDTKAFAADMVIYFETLVEEIRTKFYSLPFDFFKTGRPEYYFFQVIYENNDLFVLSNYSLSIHNTKDISTGRSLSELSKNEHIYLVQGSSGLKPFLRAVGYYNNELQNQRKVKTYKILDRDLPETFFGNYYHDIISYMKYEKLKFKRISDLSRIMSYYSELKNE
ncbi:MAG: hypothetical protein AAGF85_10530 [Bacteroidota bacterium]